jgi:hypothetical protein
MAVYECGNCERVEILDGMVPDCCSECGGSLIRIDAGAVSELEDEIHEAAQPVAAEIEPGTVSDALAMWASWHLNVPPVHGTGKFAVDLRAADAFRMLIYLRDTTARLNWLMCELGRCERCSISLRSVEYENILRRWWLDIYETSVTDPGDIPPRPDAPGGCPASSPLPSGRLASATVIASAGGRI